MATSIPLNTSSPASTANAAFADGPDQFGRISTSLGGLTLANGMTAGAGVNDGTTSNPPAYPGTYGGNAAWAPLRVGVMRNVPGTLPSGVVNSLYFIFNPNQIQTAFTMDPSQIPAQYIYGSSAAVSSQTTASAPNLTQNQSVSWSLLFDRTYDMLYDTNPEENRGVLRDVAAFYNLLATFDSNAAVPVSTPVQVVFGQTASGQLWGFTGYVTSGNITYGMFRHNMIPSRCQIDIQMMSTYVGAQTPSSAVGSGVSAAAAVSTVAGLGSSILGSSL